MSNFSKLKEKLSKEKGVTNPGGLAAKIGMEKLGKKKFLEKARIGREKAEKNRK